ncbi:muscle M-line assembly protein unc-89-like [Paramisgurnus dabryanus]|uniref:muscle M-line assembly protein unc-89-like n=1 Tax=Paramisgurnus dabryanus TaxID=90735 RepID=UPI0031F34938
MKKTFTIIILFLVCGVFGDSDVKSVSVMAGDSVSLQTNLTELQEDDVIWWRFGEGKSKDLLAEIVKYKIWYARGRFRDKLQISGSQTDLTIKNMKIKYSGLYEAEININTGTLYKRFNVTVKESPPVINSGPSELAYFTVTEGESVVLPCNVQTQRDDLILWRFGDESALIAEVDMEDDKTSVYGRFKDKLMLNDQTGDLIITDSKPKYTGVYQLKISSNKQTLYKTFNVIVRDSGLSSGVTAGLCVFFLLVIAAVIAAGLILYRRKISELKHEVKLMSVVEGESVTLHTYIELQKDTVVEWMYEDDELKKEGKKITIDDEALDGRFRDVLKLDRETGSLTITKFKAEHAGLYEVKITKSKGTSNSKFNVYLKARVRKGKMGESVILDTCIAEIQKDEAILWMFGDTTIAEYTGGTDKPTLNKTDERFKNKLEMNSQTGDLTIKNIRTENSGEYKVQIKRRSGTKERKFDVAFSVRAMKGGSVTLHTKVKIQEGDVVEWTSEDKTTLVTGMNGEDSETKFEDDEKFKDRLKMNAQTGDLTITDIRQTDEGVYTLKLTKADGKITYRIFNVDVIAKAQGNFLNQKSEMIRIGKMGEFVSLDTGVTKIQRDDEILWTFGDMRIAQYTGGSNESTLYDYIDERFTDKLEVNHQTGDLTISNFRTEHTGVYKVQIKSSSGNKERKFSVAYSVRDIKGGSILLRTKVKIQKGDEVEWTSKDKTILVTGMNGDDSKTSYTDDERFRDRLEMNPETGDLTITDIRQTDEGVYTLKLINTDGKITYRIFSVDVAVITKVHGNIQKQQNSARLRTGKVWESVTLDTRVTEIQKDDEILWTFGTEDECIAQYIGGNDKPTLNDYTDERFKDKLEMNLQTGDLTIKNMRSELTGVYKVQIKNNNGTKERKFNVALYAQAIKGGSVTLLTKVKINEGDEVMWTSEDKTTLITGMKGDDSKTSYTDDERFRDRLKMNPETGDLIITDIRQTDEGVYTLKLIKADGKITYRIFNVEVTAKGFENIHNQQNSAVINEETIKTVNFLESVTLDTGVTEIQSCNWILWMFGDMRLARCIGPNESKLAYFTFEIFKEVNQIEFKDRLNMNTQNGDLTITNIKPEDTGVYKVEINSSSGTKEKTFTVALNERVKKGSPLYLYTRVIIEEGDEVKWTSKDKSTLVTGMNGDYSKISYTDDERFRGRLEMIALFGGLIIRDIRQTDEGVYTLKLINTDGKITYRIFNVEVTDSAGVRDDSVEVNMPLLKQGADKPPQVPVHWSGRLFV